MYNASEKLNRTTIRLNRLTFQDGQFESVHFLSLNIQTMTNILTAFKDYAIMVRVALLKAA